MISAVARKVINALAVGSILEVERQWYCPASQRPSSERKVHSDAILQLRPAQVERSGETINKMALMFAAVTEIWRIFKLFEEYPTGQGDAAITGREPPLEAETTIEWLEGKVIHCEWTCPMKAIEKQIHHTASRRTPISKWN